MLLGGYDKQGEGRWERLERWKYRCVPEANLVRRSSLRILNSQVRRQRRQKLWFTPLPFPSLSISCSVLAPLLLCFHSPLWFPRSRPFFLSSCLNTSRFPPAQPHLGCHSQPHIRALQSHHTHTLCGNKNEQRAEHRHTRWLTSPERLLHPEDPEGWCCSYPRSPSWTRNTRARMKLIKSVRLCVYNWPLFITDLWDVSFTGNRGNTDVVSNTVYRTSQEW